MPATVHITAFKTKAAILLRWGNFFIKKHSTLYRHCREALIMVLEIILSFYSKYSTFNFVRALYCYSHFYHETSLSPALPATNNNHYPGYHQFEQSFHLDLEEDGFLLHI